VARADGSGRMRADMSPAPNDAFRTLADLPFFVMGRYPRDLFVGRCREAGIDGLSTYAFFERIRDVALGLERIGVSRGDRVAIVSESRPEWLVADLAILTLGAVTVPVYPTLTAAQTRYILADAGARAAFASDRTQAEKLAEIRHALPGLETTVLVSGDRDGLPGSTLTLAEVAELGHDRLRVSWGLARAYHDQARQVAPDDLATLIYTSGTTGDPKGVMLTHANIVSNVKACCEVLDLGPDDVALSFLPLSHSFERTVAYIYLASGTTVVFAEAIETIPRDLGLVRPTMMTGVPRLFEKMHARIVEAGTSGSAVRRALFRWAVAVGRARSRARLAGRRPSLVTALQFPLADRLVLSKIRARTGGRLRYLVSGSAALPLAVAEFFHAVGLRLLEGYGLTETAPVLTVNPPDAPRLGTVGPPIPGVELRIAEDGEILARGPNVMVGYYNQPEATAAVLRDGWLHTGDIGELDERGYLRITDRKKDIVITSGGKKVVPQPVESALKSHPLVAEAMVIGEKRRFPAVLIVPDFAALERRLAELGRPAGPRAELVARPDVRELYQAVVDEVNRNLAQFERLKKFALLPEELSIERGELTPTMKVRRKVVEERYRSVIETMYAEGETAAP
jgi:long-chain acyl-CoA synthetase